MDNVTLMGILTIVLAICMFYTFSITAQIHIIGRRLWRFASLNLFIGFLLICLQGILPSFLSVVTANFLIVTGEFLQVETALYFESGKDTMTLPLYIGIACIYTVSFLVFTYIFPSTAARIIFITLLIDLIFARGYITLSRHYCRNARYTKNTQGLSALFLAAALFYVFRIITTIAGPGRVPALLAPNIVTTLSLLAVIIINIAFILSMLKASLREENAKTIIQKDKLDYLFAFLSDTARHLDIQDLYKTIENILKETLRIDTAAIYIEEKEKDRYALAHIFNGLNLPSSMLNGLKKGEGVTGMAIEEDRVIELDVNTYPDKAIASLLKEIGVERLLSLPLKSTEGNFGAISMTCSKEILGTYHDEEFLYHLGEQIGLVLHNALLYRQLKDMADTDPLTRLPNRRRMRDILGAEIERTRRNGGSFILGMADLDKFKEINDTFGHDCGDLVLKQISEYFRRECREADHVCRWGGEEFLFLLVDSSLPEIRKFTERLIKKYREMPCPCPDMDSKGIKTSFSMGLAEFDPDASMDQLINLADRRLYIAKNLGRNRVEWED